AKPGGGGELPAFALDSGSASARPPPVSQAASFSLNVTGARPAPGPCFVRYRGNLAVQPSTSPARPQGCVRTGPAPGMGPVRATAATAPGSPGAAFPGRTDATTVPGSCRR